MTKPRIQAERVQAPQPPMFDRPAHRLVVMQDPESLQRLSLLELSWPQASARTHYEHLCDVLTAHAVRGVAIDGVRFSDTAADHYFPLPESVMAALAVAPHE